MRLLRRSLPSTSAIFAFEAVARQLSFKKAADELNVTQPSVSYAIRKLEDHLGLKLFERLHRRIELTPQGDTLYRDIAKAFDIIEKSLGTLHEHTDQTVRIAATTVFATQFLVPRLPEFEVQYPSINLDILTVDWPTSPDAKTDFSLHLDRSGIGSSYLFALAIEEIFPVCTKDYLERHGTLSSPRDLADHKLIHLEDRHFDRTSWNDWTRLVGYPGIKFNNMTTRNSYMVVLQSAIAGQGIALGWRHLVSTLLEEGTLIRPLQETAHTGNMWYLRERKEKRLRPVAATVKDWLLAETAQFRD